MIYFQNKKNWPRLNCHLEPILRLGDTYNASVVKIYNATSSLLRFEVENISSTLKKRSSLLHTACIFKIRTIGSFSQT
jgi:hypothetical protein